MKLFLDNPHGVMSNIKNMPARVEIIGLEDSCFYNENLSNFLDEDETAFAAVLQNDLAVDLRRKGSLLPNKLLIPSERHLMYEDKYYFHRWMLDNFAHLLPLPVSGLPVVLKKGNDRSGRGVKLYDTYELALSQKDDTCIIQRAIPGAKELAIHFVAVEGEIKKLVIFEHDFSSLIETDYYIRGDGLHNKEINIIESSVFEDDIRAVIQKTGFYGIGCLDAKVFEDKLYILEMNTHLGVSMVFYDHIHQQLFPFLLEAKAHYL